MRAIQVAKFGGPEELTLADIAPPQPAPGEALVEIELAGVNFIDVYMRNGSYARSHTYKTPLPMTIGMEGGGRIAALGPQVSGLAVGDRVAWCLSRGSYAEFATVPAWKLTKVPDNVPMDVAVTLMLQGCTAHYLSHSAFPLQPGQTCLVHAGAGGVGQLLIQLAKRRGATVLATVGSAEKAGIAKARGADHVILYREADFAEEVARITGDEGAHVVYDSVGRDTFDRSLKCLRRRGLLVNFGASSGQARDVNVLDLAEAGSVFLTRPHLADYMASREEISGRTSDLFAAWRDGALHVEIDRVLPLAEAVEAHRIIEGRQTRGKMLLRVKQGGADNAA